MCNNCRAQPASIAPSIPVLNALFEAFHKHHANAMDDDICAVGIGYWYNIGTTYANKIEAHGTSIAYGCC